MASQAGRGLRPGGVVRALIRLIVFVGFAFGAGVLVGIVIEEPELLAGHLRGDSQSVDLVANGSRAENAESSEVGHGANVRNDFEEEQGSGLPSVAASRSTPRSGTSTATGATDFQGREPRHSSHPRVGEPARVDGVKGWAIQVGAFSDEGAALRLARSLRAKGYPVELFSDQVGTGRWRVRVQPMSGETTARETAAKLKRDERLPTWVLPMETS